MVAFLFESGEDGVDCEFEEARRWVISVQANGVETIGIW